MSPVVLYGYSMSSKRDHSHLRKFPSSFVPLRCCCCCFFFSRKFSSIVTFSSTFTLFICHCILIHKEISATRWLCFVLFFGGEKFYQNMNTFLLLTDWTMQNRWDEDTWESNLYSTILRCIRHETYYKIIDTEQWRGSATGNRTVKGQLAPGKL